MTQSPARYTSLSTMIARRTKALFRVAADSSGSNGHRVPGRTRMPAANRITRVIPAAVFLPVTANALSDHYFRDEFYYLACSRHMAWGYVDQPPLSIAALWLVRHVAGDSLIVLRVTAAIVAAAAVWLTGRLAARLGGSAFAQA